MNQLRTIGAAISERHGFFSIDQIIRRAGLSRQTCRDVLADFSKLPANAFFGIGRIG